MARNPNWTREEVILALELYLREGRQQVDARHPEVIALSRLLNRLEIHPSERRGEAFRNPAGVSMKLGNFLAVDPAYEGAGLSRGSKLERAIWAEFVGEPRRLRAAAEVIRKRETSEPPSDAIVPPVRGHRHEAVRVDGADVQSIPPSFDPDRFRDAHDLFLSFVRAEGGVSFDEIDHPFQAHPFFLTTEVAYKRRARADALALLPPPGEWHTWIGTPGRLLQALSDATFRSHNLLERRHGDANNSASPVYLMLGRSEAEQTDLERELARLFDGPTDPAVFGPRFDRLAGFVRERSLGCKWDFFAYLAFLADDARYFPIKPSYFQDLLRFYGSDAPLAGHVAWDRYETVLALGDWIRDRHPKRYGRADAVEIQSYLWIVAYAVVPRLTGALRTKVLTPDDFETEARLRLAKAAERERIGLLGERLCYERERARLRGLGRDDLATRVDLVSRRNDGAGFDLLTFKDNGEPLHVEIKTTTWTRASGRGFWLSRNEHAVAERDERWCLWRVWDVEGFASIEHLGNPARTLPDGWSKEASGWKFERRDALNDSEAG